MTRSLARPPSDKPPSDVIEHGTRVAATVVRDRMHTSPFLFLGLGAVGGYLLGGGLSLRLGSAALRTVSHAMMGDVAAAMIRGVAKARSQDRS
jgi:hypothetical protein